MNQNAFLSDLRNVPWNSYYIFENIDDIWSHWSGLFKQVLEHSLVPRVFVPLDQRSENESSGSNHFEITSLPIRFHAICIYGACLKWLL